MKKAVLLLIIVFIHNSVFATQNLESTRAKFIDAKPCEWWRIDDNWTRVYDEPDDAYDDWRYIYRNKYSLTWFDFFHTKAFIGKFKKVRILKTTGYVERWKFVKYGIISKGKLKVRYGWILATTVEEAIKRK